MLQKLKAMGLLLALLVTLGAVSAHPVAAQSAPCDLSGTIDGTATPNSGTTDTIIIFRATNFTPGEAVSFYFTLPNGNVFGTPRPIANGVNADGTVGPLPLTIPQAFLDFPGTWAITFQGASSNHVSIIKFCVTTTAQPPQATDTAVPPSATTAPAATDTAVPPSATTAPAATETATTAPTVAATETATAAPTTAATAVASETATAAPTTAATAVASETATAAPTVAPTDTVAPTVAPTQPAVAPTIAPAPPTVAPPMQPPPAMPTPIYGGGVQPSAGGQPPGMPTTGQADLSGLLFVLLAGLSLCSLGLLARRRVAGLR
ncbi:MAG: hypothetical protein M3Z04_06640 [Chloroflexota bacterium]|nr:hypothetical protein [Chloroflexota bacterium]